jgi:hypothetical protein
MAGTSSSQGRRHHLEWTTLGETTDWMAVFSK